MAPAETLDPEVLAYAEPYLFSDGQVRRLVAARLLPDGGFDVVDGTVRMAGHGRPWPFSLREYHRMRDLAILTEDDRIELIEGQLVRKMTVSSTHAAAVNRLARLFYLHLGPDEATVSVQNPLDVGEGEPEPDLMLLRPRPDGYARAHPTPADVLLAVEVSVTTVDLDRRIKVPLYARHGVPEVWLVIPEEGAGATYRERDLDRYARAERLGREGTLTCAAFPRLRLAVSDVLPPNA